MIMISYQKILDTKMQPNDAGASTIRDYLVGLLSALWKEGESFSSKRPFGNSGWEIELYRALIQAKVTEGSIDEYGNVSGYNKEECWQLIAGAIKNLR